VDTHPANNKTSPVAASEHAALELYPLSLAQQQIWVAQLAAGVTPIYNLLATYHIHGKIDTALFQHACELTVQQSDVLQTAFLQRPPTNVFQYRDKSITANCEIVDLDIDQSIEQWSRREGRRSLDLAKKCFRFKLGRLPDKSCIFYFSIHHLIADGAVLQLLWQQISHHYQQLSNDCSADSTHTDNTLDAGAGIALYQSHVANQHDHVCSEARADSMHYWLDKAKAPFTPTGYYGLEAKPGYDIERTYWHPDATVLDNIHTALEHSAFSIGSKNKSLFVLLATAIIITAAKAQTNSHQRLGFPARSRKESAYRDALGVYISIGFLDIKINKNDTVAQLSHKIKDELDKSLEHLDSSIQNAHITRAFSTSLNIILAQANTFGPIPVTTVARMNGYSDSSSSVNLHITDFSGDGQYTFMFDMATSVFSEYDQQRYIKHFKTVLSSITAAPNTVIADIAILSADERAEILALGNGEPSKTNKTDTIHKIFEQISTLYPGRIALVESGQTFCYAQLNRQADSLSALIRHLGVKTEQSIGVYFERSIAAYVAILAVLKTGARFLPLDTHYPQHRLEFMLADSGTNLLLAQSGLKTLDVADSIIQIELDRTGRADESQKGLLKAHPNFKEVPKQSTGEPKSAYLMYTSGSSGEPKGVIGTHRATLNRLEWMWSRFPFSEQDVCVNKTALSFVDSIWELFGPLLAGTPTVIFSDDDVLDIFRFSDELERHQITRLVIVPSLLSILLDSDENISNKLTRLQQVVVSGEPLTAELARRFYEKITNSTLVNLYGSTEVSADITCIEITKQSVVGRIPVGHAIDGTQIMLLDEHLQMVPQGCIGEICVAGESLSAGYHNRPELQAEKFLRNPYGSALLFRTGDLGRFNANGQLEHRGRNDDQMKIQGQRFEVSEIEHHVVSFDGIKRCKAGINGDGLIYACFEQSKEQSIDVVELEVYLQSILPPYMQPAVLIALQTLPLLANGKIDRQALVKLTQTTTPTSLSKYDALNDREALLLSIWQEILGIDKLDLTEDFFAIGGNSVSAMRIVVAVRETGFSIELSDILQTGSIRQIATTLSPLPAHSTVDQTSLKIQQDKRVKVVLDQQQSNSRIEDKVNKVKLSNNPNARFTPDNEIEQLLLPIWQHVLKQQDIDLRADFFAIGGNSIAAMQIMVGAKKSGLRINLRQVVALGSIEKIASSLITSNDVNIEITDNQSLDMNVLSNASEQQIHSQLHSLGHVIPTAELNCYPLSGSQRGILFHMMMYGLEKPLYGAQGRADLIGEIDPSDWNEQHKHDKREELARETVTQLINLQQAPLLRVLLIKMSKAVHHFVVDFHHIMFDGWSAASLGEELAVAYKALLNGTQPSFDKCGQFKQHVASVNSQDKHSVETFWRDKLKGFRTPTGVSTIRTQSEYYATGNHRLLLDTHTTTAITELAIKCRVTPNTLVQAAWAILLSRRHHTEDVLYGFAVTGRSSGIHNYESAVGMFVNSLPMRVNCNGASEIKPFLQALQTEILSLIEFENSSLVDIMQVSELDAHLNLFDTLMVFQNVPAPWDDPNMPYQITNRHNHENSHIPLTIEIFPESQLRILFLYIPEYCDSSQISSIATNFRDILETMVRLGSSGLVAEIAQTTPAQLKNLTDQFNDTYFSYDKTKSVTDLIWEQAARTPTAIAASFEDTKLSYLELTQKADKLANYLDNIGVEPKMLVGVCIPRSIEMLVSLLAISRTGAAYVPIDPEYPDERVNHIVYDSGLAHIICLSNTAPTAQHSQINVVHLDKQCAEIESTPDTLQGIISTKSTKPHDLAYMIYTSGSTGLPKGVKVSNQNVTNLLLSMQQRPGMCATDSLLAVTTVSFDIAVLELFLPLISGARVDIAPQHIVYDSFALAKRISTESINCMQATPTTWRLLLAAGWQGDQHFKCLVGGEALPPDLCHELLPITGELWNMYGPTETTVWSTCARIRNANSLISVGRPISNTRVLILDNDNNLCPINKPGELCIAGDGVSLGYHNQDSLTKEKFVTHSFSQNKTQIVFKTGDLARWLDNGELECLGRIDRQIKLHGHRIEPAEIESVLNSIESIRYSVVHFHKSSQVDRLIAYVVFKRTTNVDASNNDNEIEVALRNRLRRQLPEYMVPAAIVSLSEIPLLPNGKVDIHALPNPFTDSLADYHNAAQVMTDSDSTDMEVNKPTTATQKILCELFQNALQLERVSIHSNFFDIGGNSLIAMQLVAAAARNKIDVKIAQLFELGTISALAHSIDANSTLPNTIEPEAQVTASSHSKADLDRIAALLGKK